MRSVLDGRRGELAEMEQRLARIEEEAAKADAEHSRWTEATAKQRAEGNAKIDELQERLRVLDEKVADRQREHDAILQSMDALGQRLRGAG